MFTIVGCPSNCACALCFSEQTGAFTPEPRPFIVEFARAGKRYQYSFRTEGGARAYMDRLYTKGVLAPMFYSVEK